MLLKEGSNPKLGMSTGTTDVDGRVAIGLATAVKLLDGRLFPGGDANHYGPQPTASAVIPVNIQSTCEQVA